MRVGGILPAFAHYKLIGRFGEKMIRKKGFFFEEKKTQRGFTLIELLVSMTIVAVLLGLALVSYQGARRSARDGKRRADLEEIRSALEMCYADDGVYPGSIYDNVTCETSGRTYLSGTPKDPATDGRYSYNRLSPTTYDLCATLETGGSHCVYNP